MSKANTSLIWALTFLTSVVIVVIGLLAVFGSKDNTLVASTIQTIVTLITMIAGILLTLKVTAEAKVVSEDNNVKISAVVEDVKIIHSAVNSSKEALEKKVDDLSAQVVAKDQTIAESDKTLAIERTERAADSVAQQVKDDAANAANIT